MKFQERDFEERTQLPAALPNEEVTPNLLLPAPVSSYRHVDASTRDMSGRAEPGLCLSC